jgi:hypothetical protein
VFGTVAVHTGYVPAVQVTPGPVTLEVDDPFTRTVSVHVLGWNVA